MNTGSWNLTFPVLNDDLDILAHEICIVILQAKLRSKSLNEVVDRHSWHIYTQSDITCVQLRQRRRNHKLNTCHWLVLVDRYRNTRCLFLYRQNNKSNRHTRKQTDTLAVSDHEAHLLHWQSCIPMTRPRNHDEH